LNRPDLSLLDDAFTFNVLTGELVLFSDAAPVLLNAILEMALYVRGFDTLLNDAEEWHVRVAIGAWHYVRAALKERLGLEDEPEWPVTINDDIAARFNMLSFGILIDLAGRPNLLLSFPSQASAQAIIAYQRLRRIMETVAFEIGLNDHATFNARLHSAVRHIEAEIKPADDISIFDDLLGPDGFDERFFADDVDSPGPSDALAR
jgi:hypothetical protein